MAQQGYKIDGTIKLNEQVERHFNDPAFHKNEKR